MFYKFYNFGKFQRLNNCNSIFCKIKIVLQNNYNDFLLYRVKIILTLTYQINRLKFKKMKKFFAVVAVAALSLGAVSCGEKKAEEAPANVDSAAVTVDSAAAVVDSAAAVVDSAAAKVDSAATKVEGAAKEVAPATEAPAK